MRLDSPFYSLTVNKICISHCKLLIFLVPNKKKSSSTFLKNWIAANFTNKTNMADTFTRLLLYVTITIGWASVTSRTTAILTRQYNKLFSNIVQYQYFNLFIIYCREMVNFRAVWNCSNKLGEKFREVFLDFRLLISRPEFLSNSSKKIGGIMVKCS